MVDTTLIPAETPGGETIVVAVVDLDGTAMVGGSQRATGLPSLNNALKSITDVTAGLRGALQAVRPDKTTVEFSIRFVMRAGQITAMVAAGKSEGSISLTMEWNTSRTEESESRDGSAAVRT